MIGNSFIVLKGPPIRWWEVFACADVGVVVFVFGRGVWWGSFGAERGSVGFWSYSLIGRAYPSLTGSKTPTDWSFTSFDICRGSLCICWSFPASFYMVPNWVPLPFCLCCLLIKCWHFILDGYPSLISVFTCQNTSFPLLCSITGCLFLENYLSKSSIFFKYSIGNYTLKL